MPARKKKNTQEEQIPEETPDPQQEAFEKLSNKLTATFESGFEKLQQALINMATPALPQAADTQPQKRPAEDEIHGPNTRNKAMRPAYNPKEPTKVTGKQAKGKSNKTPAQTRRQEDAVDAEQTELVHLGTTSAAHLEIPNVNKPTTHENRDYTMNEWIINQAPKHKGSFSFNPLPTSAAAIPADPHLEAQVQNVLINTASNLAKGNVPAGIYIPINMY